jgi:hypothetical protein
LDYPADTLHETIPHFHDTPARVEALREALRRDAAGRAAGARDAVDFAWHGPSARASWWISCAPGVCPCA